MLPNPSVLELVSRVIALLRRSYRESSPLAEKLIFNDGDLEINMNKMIVKKGKILPITLMNLNY